MEYEVEKLLGESVLNEQKKGLSIAVVEGMAGIGKTTLAHQIYNHPDVVNRFPYRAWAMVSSKFTLEGTMMQLILQLPGSDKQKLRELEESKKDVKNELQGILYKLLQGQTYFIVLDDVWEMKHWESLESAFPNEQDKTSRLLVTTRSQYIAKHERYTHYEMKVLDPEKSWELFLMKALISDGGCPEELEPICREIVRRCEGLPSTISEVGGLLVQTRTKRGWQQVLDQVIRYQNLSPKLRQCFLHLALFKEYATIPAKTLLHIWLVQGLIEVQAGQTEEKSARQCLDELISQNMLQIVDWTMGGCARNVYLDGILREVCLRRANEELGLETVNTRHAVVYGANIGTLSQHQYKNLHSLFLHNDEGVDVSSLSPALSKGCQLLKILHLDGIKLSTFPNSFRKLTTLKYLMIRRHKIHPKCALDEVDDHLEAVKLPNWLVDLKHLEIVDMEGEKVEFPNDVTLEMKRLRYFSAYCVRGPISINSWKNIKTLKYMRQEDWIKCYSRSSNCNVRKLGLVLDPLSKPDEWRKVRASLESLRRLEHLQLRWNRFIPFDLHFFYNFGSRLTKLKLRGKLTKCPEMTIFPPNLSHLTLAFSDLIEDLMPQLSKLPNLSHLKLLGNAERIQVLSFSSPRLRVLILKEMFHLKCINIVGDGMPCLEQLRIQQCPSLRTMNLPAYIAVEFIT